MGSLPPTNSADKSVNLTTGAPTSSPALLKLDQTESADVSTEDSGSHKISAYARLDFDNYAFFVQTLQIVLGRKANHELLPSAHHLVDVHLSSKRAISRRHAKIFYNFGTQRFEISVLGRNGAFVDDLFIEKGITVHLVDGTRIQIGDIPFSFVLPSTEPADSESKHNLSSKFFNPTEALNLRTNLYLSPHSPCNTKKKPLILSADIETEQKPNTKSFCGFRISKADISRRLSVARRKSLASSSNDEISALLKELGAFRDEKDIEDDTQFDPDLVLCSLGDRKSLSSDQIQRQEDELDRLVKQHNMTQGMDQNSDTSFAKNIDLDVIDLEGASLVPLIDAEDQLPLAGQRELENVSKYHNTPLQGYFGASTDSTPASLMGKPVGPRMGKPAPIPPPGGSLYGRPAINPISCNAAGSGYAQTLPGYGAYSGYSGSVYNLMSRLPQPKLEVAVETITRVPVRSLIIPFKAITVDVNFFEKPPICAFKTTEPVSCAPKIPNRKKDAACRKLAKVQNLKEVPDQFKTKPSLSFLAMVSVVLKKTNNKGNSFRDILDGIRELFPYYKYCPDGWQFSVMHGIKYNPMFIPLVKDGPDSEWVWALDEKYLEEREARRKKLQELAVAKAKELVIRAIEYRPRPKYPSYRGGPGFVAGHSSSMNQSLAPNQSFGVELSAEPRKDGPYTYTNPLSQMAKSGQENVYQKIEKAEGSIKEQLSANCARIGANQAVVPVPLAAKTPLNGSRTTPSTPIMNQDTKKSLKYLQKELFALYKARKLSYNTVVTTEIITKALATTIGQVNSIGAKSGCGDNALAFLVEKAPKQVSKILDIALTKSIKEHQALTSRTQSPTLSSSRNANTLKPVEEPLSKPATLGSGLGRPSFGGPRDVSGAKSTIKPPQFYSNKPIAPEKRSANSSPGSALKVIKLDD